MCLLIMLINKTHLQGSNDARDSRSQTSRSEVRLLGNEVGDSGVDVWLNSVLDVGHDGGRVSSVNSWAVVGIGGGAGDVVLEGHGRAVDWQSSDEASAIGLDAAVQVGHTGVDGGQVAHDGGSLAADSGGADAGSEKEGFGDGNHFCGLKSVVGVVGCLVLLLGDCWS